MEWLLIKARSVLITEIQVKRGLQGYFLMCMLSLTQLRRIYQMTTKTTFTIPGFNRLTKQQMFNMAGKHLLSTGQKAYSRGTCTYSGSGCAASVFLQEDARGRLDGEGSWNDLVHANFVSKHNHPFINELQVAHDSTPSHFGSEQFMREWKEEMLKIAHRYNLDASFLEETHD